MGGDSKIKKNKTEKQKKYLCSDQTIKKRKCTAQKKVTLPHVQIYCQINLYFKLVRFVGFSLRGELTQLFLTLHLCTTEQLQKKQI